MNDAIIGLNALVCGSTDGIGKATAFALAQSGATVTLLARNSQKLEKVCSQLPTSFAQKHDFLVADFTKSQEVKKVAENIIRSGKVFHILINNTGGPAPVAAIEADITAYQKAFEQHLINNQLLTQAVVCGMKKVHYGRVINITSISVKEPIIGLGVSNTIRWAVAAWAKTLSKELGHFGITVNNILPGYIETSRLNALLQQRAEQQQKTVEEVKEELIKEIPAGKIGKPEDIAAAIAFLASPLAGYINGINLPVDGGKLNAM
jgi:3-oxoacyl-[acyl-carrier protein] reductase